MAHWDLRGTSKKIEKDLRRSTSVEVVSRTEGLRLLLVCVYVCVARRLVCQARVFGRTPGFVGGFVVSRSLEVR